MATGCMTMGNKQLDEALALFDQALARQPNPDALYGKAQVLMRQGSQAAALQSVQQAIALQPSHPGYHALARQLGAPTSPPPAATSR